MQSSPRNINDIYQHLSEALRSDSGDFPYPGQVFFTDPDLRIQNKHWGQGVVVRNMDDSLTNDENFNVVPGTFWHDDIWPPNQIYPWCDDSGNGTDIMGGDDTGNGAWVTPTLAVAIGPEHFNAIFNSPDLQVANWTDGVWYAHDSNSCDKRALYCKGTDEKGYYEGYDCPGAWVDLKNYISGNPFIFTPDTTKLGSGYFLAGNPYNPDKDNPGKNFGGGGTGMHCFYSYYEVSKENPQYEYQINGSKEDPLLPNCLFADYSCQINYSAWNTSTTGIMEDSVEGWHPWIKRFREGAEALQKPVCAWAADLAIGWMNNPRPMITLQNALWKYREEWCDNDSDQPKDPNRFDHYWGWNEIPFSRVQIKDPDNCTCFIIVLPPNDKNLYITLSQWLLDYPHVAQNLIDQLDTYEKETYSNFQSGVSQVLVVKQIPYDSVWRRWFCVEEVEILRSKDKEKGLGWKIGQNGVIQKF